MKRGYIIHLAFVPPGKDRYGLKFRLLIHVLVSQADRNDSEKNL